MSFASLAKLAARLPVPKDYFSGVRAPEVVRADNILMFHRDGFSELRQRALENQSHHRFVLLIPLVGGAGVSLDGAEHALEPGSALLVHPFQFHFFLHPAAGRLSWLVLTFESETPEALGPLRDRPVRLAPDALRRLESLLKAYHGSGYAGGAELRLTVEILLQKLARAPGVGVAVARKKSEREPAAWASRINRLLHDGGPREHRIAALAGELGVSERLLRLRFLENFGVSLGGHIRNFRINRAAGLLTQSDLPLGEVAGRCGYASQAAFSRAFLARTGLTPRAYRVRHRV